MQAFYRENLLEFFKGSDLVIEATKNKTIHLYNKKWFHSGYMKQG